MIHDNIVAAPELASEGLQKIEWVRRNMPILKKIQSEFEVQQPFVGKRITVCIHLEAKTAYLALVLRSGGAEVSVTGSNPESTKDDVVAALAEEGLKVYARHGAKPQEMRKYMEMALEIKPQLVIDDGGDLVEILHENQTGMLEGVIGACEETTTGVLRAQAREKAGQLQFPVMLVNEARCKYLFDNVHGTGQSVWDAVMRSTNLVLAGKTVVIVGYGWCGRGCAMRAQGLGASVIVCEVDPVKACDALMNGCRVMPLLEACAEADVVLSVTGVRHTLCKEHFHVLKDNALLANAGHFWEEIDTPGLKEISVDKQQMRTNVEGFQMQDGRWLNLLGNGNIVNIACADGHPAEIMDTSFALQALSARHLVEHANVLEKRCYPVPGIIDERVARIRLQSSGVSYDTLTEDQQQYLSDWEA
ncbi:MAG TPA: adenosylhomocysteinase [SAR324 cluster bacterium]|nr:adenosylhomocysteinase [Deltaproteobacteria bacterium]HJL86735.1 adenosylhomocysteinase [SAR324 cluster bacterium]